MKLHSESNIQEKLRAAMNLIEESLLLLSTDKDGASNQVHPARKPKEAVKDKSLTVDMDFSLNARAFFKRYVSGLSGPNKFVLVVTFLAKGDLAHEVSLEVIEAEWKRASGILGGDFQRMYSTRAKENDWVDCPKKGIYVLRPDWNKAFSKI